MRIRHTDARVIVISIAVAAFAWGSSANTQVVIPPAAAGQESADVSFASAVVTENHLSRQEAGRASVTIDSSGQFRATNVTLLQLLMPLYDVRINQIVGAPGWIGRDHFDIAANAPDGFEPGHTVAMLRKLLEDRFQLVARQGLRRTPTYSLEWATRNRRRGPRLRPPSPECDQRGARGAVATPRDGFGCQGAYGLGSGRIFVKRGPIASLALFLTTAAGRPVIDKTGLAGIYDIDLTFAPDPDSLFGALVGPSSAGGVSIFTAVRDQLGLKLEPSTEVLDVLAIERVEHPTPD